MARVPIINWVVFLLHCKRSGIVRFETCCAVTRPKKQINLLIISFVRSIYWTMFSYKGNYKVSQKENLMLKCPQRPESDFNLRHQNPLCLTNFSWRIFFGKFLTSKHSFETWRKLHSEKKYSPSSWSIEIQKKTQLFIFESFNSFIAIIKLWIKRKMALTIVWVSGDGNLQLLVW